MYGISEPSSKIRVSDHNSFAYQAGLRHGDRVVVADDKSIQSLSELRWAILRAGMDGQALRLKVERPDPMISGYSMPSTSRQEVTLSFKGAKKEDFESNFMSKLGIDPFLPPAKLNAIAARQV